MKNHVRSGFNEKKKPDQKSSSKTKMEGGKNKTKLQKLVSNPDEVLPADSINSNRLG